jgi:hypothetical protein
MNCEEFIKSLGKEDKNYGNEIYLKKDGTFGIKLHIESGEDFFPEVGK